MLFPFSLGDSAFDIGTRISDAEETLSRVAGIGGFADNPDLIISKTRGGIAKGISLVSLTCDRLLEQIYPGSSHSDIIDFWEKSYRVIRQEPDYLESRQKTVGDIFADFSGIRTELGQGSGRGIDTVQYLEQVVGIGNCTYKYNTAASIAFGGYDPHIIFAVAFEVPVSEISTFKQIQKLKNIVDRHKPAHVGIAITRIVSRGFLCDDLLSLVDRDVLRI